MDDDDDDSDGSEIGGDREHDEPQDPATIKAKMKTKANEDWNYLKQTLSGNRETEKERNINNQGFPMGKQQNQ